MPDLYSLNGGTPAPLPFRIRVPDGVGGLRTRTDPASFTTEELAAAGYVAADAPPAPSARQLPAVWVDGAWSLPNKPLATRKAELLAAAKARYAAIANGGTTATIAPGVTIAVATAAEPVVKLMRAVAHMDAEQLSSMAVVTTAGAPVDLTPAIAEAMLEAIDSHVADCEACQNDLVTAILAVADDAEPTAGHDALDLVDTHAGTVDGEGGWP